MLWRLVVFGLVGSFVFACSSKNTKAPVSQKRESNQVSDNVVYEGEKSQRQQALEFVDRAMKEQGDFGVYGDLTKGLFELELNYGAKVVDSGDLYDVSVYPTHGQGGHDFSFTVNKKTGKLSKPVVGEVLPPPEF